VLEEKELFGLPREKERLLEVYVKDPEGSLARLAGALRRYRDLAIAPYWSRIQEHLEGDAIGRGQALAMGGVEALLSGLNPMAHYAGGVLKLEKTLEAVVEPAGRGINPGPLRVRLATRRGARPAGLPAHPRVRSPRGREPVDLVVPTVQRVGAGGGAGRQPGFRPQGPAPRPDYHDGAFPATRPRPGRGLGPPFEAQGRRARRALPKGQEGLLQA
jgi:hypothetical protein